MASMRSCSPRSMVNDAFETALRGIAGPDAVREKAPLADLTTFHVGGPADWLVEVRTMDGLAALLGAAKRAGQPVTVLGGGSNVVISDEGVRGVVVRPLLSSVSQPAPDRVRAEA